MKSYLFFFSLFCLCQAVTAQENGVPDSTKSIIKTTMPDSVIVIEAQNIKVKKKENFFTKDYPIPKRAMLLSFVVPGAGQIYNKKYWKAPLAIGGTIAMVIVVRNNSKTYRLLRDSYAARVDLETSTEADPRFVNWADEDIRKERDKWNKWREMSYIGLIAVQAFAGVDAFVDAHLYGYKINEDLSFKVKPSFETMSGNDIVMGIGVSFNFGR